MHKYIGYDLWKYNDSLESLCNIATTEDISLYDIYIKDHSFYFYTLIWQRHKVEKGISCKYVNSYGALAFIYKEIKNILFYIRLFIVCIVWYFLLNLTYIYEINGIEGTLKQNMNNDLAAYNFPQFMINVEDIENNLFNKYRNQLSWLEVYKKGSKLFVEFSEKKSVNIEELQREPLYAYKDAVIAYFDVQHGNKLVSINDFVYKGSVLVDSYMLDSTNVSKELYVKGKVFGYTWYIIESKIEIQESIHDALAFFRLLMDCRNQIDMYLDDGEKIVKETILHYQQDKGTIVMRVHYTLLEDITIP